MHVSPAGAIADVLWHEIKNHAKNIELGEFVVMPNHIHGILILNGNDVGGRDDDGCRDVACNGPTMKCTVPTMGNIPTTTDCNILTMGNDPMENDHILGTDDANDHIRGRDDANDHIRGGDVACNVPTMGTVPTTTDCNIPTMGNDPAENDHIRGTDIANDRFRGDDANDHIRGTDVACNVRTSKNEFMAAISPKSNTVSTIIRSYKSAVTKYCNRLGLPIAWQSRFHDHIIRNDESFQRISKYISDNPMNWPEDQFFK